jgi:putative tryptophan/tyrosine transport system substrate-binding protein
MRRREFAAGLGAAVAWPLAAPAQQPRRGPVVGFLTTRSQEEAADHRAAFLRGLERAGYVEERNVHVEYRWAGGRNERLGALRPSWLAFRCRSSSRGGTHPPRPRRPPRARPRSSS